MEFLKGVCPHCKGELQSPQDRDRIICMYCGKELSVKDALAQQEEVSRPTPVMDETVIEAMQNLLFGIENPMQFFKKALYKLINNLRRSGRPSARCFRQPIL